MQGAFCRLRSWKEELLTLSFLKIHWDSVSLFLAPQKCLIYSQFVVFVEFLRVTFTKIKPVWRPAGATSQCKALFLFFLWAQNKCVDKQKGKGTTTVHWNADTSYHARQVRVPLLYTAAFLLALQVTSLVCAANLRAVHSRIQLKLCLCFYFCVTVWVNIFLWCSVHELSITVSIHMYQYSVIWNTIWSHINVPPQAT